MLRIWLLLYYNSSNPSLIDSKAFDYFLYGITAGSFLEKIAGDYSFTG